MVLMFVLTVFMIVQFALRDTINTKEDQLTDLNQQLAGLADSLGLERSKTAALEATIGSLSATLAGREADLAAATGRISGLEGQLAGLKGDLESARADLTAATLELEEQRRKAEETLTLLAAAETAKARLAQGANNGA